MIDIPGLKSIWDEVRPDGTTRIILEVDDDRLDKFFEALGIDSGDTEALQDMIIRALEHALENRTKHEG